MKFPRPVGPIAIGVVVAWCGVAAFRIANRAPDIAIAWGNAWAESERRAAAHDARKAEEKRQADAKVAENEAWNDVHCKVIVIEAGTFSGDLKEYTRVLRVEPVKTVDESGLAYIYFSGGIRRRVYVRKTEDCR